MELQPHQQRVLTEKDELDEKRNKLAAFIDTDPWNALPEEERNLLTLQYEVMTEYSTILGQRIAAFSE